MICRDGGRYHQANGTEATVEHCKAAYIDLLQENERLKTEREAFVAVDSDRLDLLEKTWQALGGELLPEDPSPEPSPPVSGYRDLDALELARQRMRELVELQAKVDSFQARQAERERWAEDYITQTGTRSTPRERVDNFREENS